MNSKGPAPSRARKQKSRMLKAIGKMSNQLLKKCNAIKSLLAKGTRLDSQHRYKVAQLVQEVWNAGPMYGQNAMERLAAALGWSTSTAYRYKDVAEMFAPDEFEQLLQKSDEYGRPLTWQHFQELSKVENDEERHKLLATVLNDRLSTRQLAKMIRGVNPPKKCKSGSKKTSGPTTTDVQTLAMESKAFADQVQLRTVRLAEKLDRATSAAARRNLRSEVIEFRNGLLQASRACQAGVERLDECLQTHKDEDAGDVLQFSAAMSPSLAVSASAGA